MSITSEEFEFMSKVAVNHVSDLTANLIAEKALEDGRYPHESFAGVVYQHCIDDPIVCGEFHSYLNGLFSDPEITVADATYELVPWFKSYLFNLIKAHW